MPGVRVSVLAIISLILAVLSVLICCTNLLAIPAVICGVISLRKIDNGEVSGKWIAMTGVIIGNIVLLLNLIGFFLKITGVLAEPLDLKKYLNKELKEDAEPAESAFLDELNSQPERTNEKQGVHSNSVPPVAAEESVGIDNSSGRQRVGRPEKSSTVKRYTFRKGQKVEVSWKGKRWFPAKIIRCEERGYYVHYYGHGEEDDELVQDARLRPLKNRSVLNIAKRKYHTEERRTEKRPGATTEVRGFNGSRGIVLPKYKNPAVFAGKKLTVTTVTGKKYVGTITYVGPSGIDIAGGSWVKLVKFTELSEETKKKYYSGSK